MIACDAGDGDRLTKQLRLTDHLAGAAHLRQHAARYFEKFEQLRIPAAGTEVVKHRARGVAGVGDVRGAAGQFPNQPTVHRAEGQLAGAGFGACAFHIFQQPSDLGGGKISVQHEAGLAADQWRFASGAEAIAFLGGAAILPHDRVVNGLAGFAVPQQRGLPLVGDADGGNVGGIELGFFDSGLGGGELGFPDGIGVMLHPAGFGENLREFLLRHRLHAASAIKNNGP